ncbi:MAG: hypothetical protein U0802_19025 [Candidatus Binatia bacterium]
MGRRQRGRFRPFFDRPARGELSLAVTTISIAEVLTGPLARGGEALAEQYRAVLESWYVVAVTPTHLVVEAPLDCASPVAVQVRRLAANGSVVTTSAPALFCQN